MLFEEIVYGPIRSRRLGVSLGINLMPQHGKICSFDCVYCECGYNAHYQDRNLPMREQVREALTNVLEGMFNPRSTPDEDPKTEQSSSRLDVITFSGNGEPTLHPDFEAIIADTCALRDRYCPTAKVSVLSNSTQLGRPDVVRALRMCDNRILKLDSAIDETMRLIDQPVNKSLTVQQVVDWLRVFEGDFVLQTCFLRGTLSDHYGQEQAGKRIDNTCAQELEAWYQVVETLRPRQLMIYVIDRATPEQELEKITRPEMEQIAAPLVAKGFDVSISA